MNDLSWIRNATFGFVLATFCVLAVIGCGGQGEKSGEAIVISSESLSTGSTTTPSAAPAEGTSATPAAATPAPSTAEATPAGGGAEGWGTIKGRVVFNGDPPEARTIDTSAKNPEVCAKNPHKSQRLVVDPASKGVQFAMVYLPKPTKVNPESESAATQAVVDFDQNECTFAPHVLGVMKGAKVVLKSGDPIPHNINAKMRVNPSLNPILQPKQQVTYDVRAAERGPIFVTCDIHPWMKAVWLVTDNPYFAVTDEKGNFEIKNVPAGSQKLVVWQEATTYVTSSSGQAVTVKPGETTTLEFKIDPSKVKPE